MSLYPYNLPGNHAPIRQHGCWRQCPFDVTTTAKATVLSTRFTSNFLVMRLRKSLGTFFKNISSINKMAANGRRYEFVVAAVLSSHDKETHVVSESLQRDAKNLRAIWCCTIFCRHPLTVTLCLNLSISLLPPSYCHYHIHSLYIERLDDIELTVIADGAHMIDAWQWQYFYGVRIPLKGHSSCITFIKDGIKKDTRHQSPSFYLTDILAHSYFSSECIMLSSSTIIIHFLPLSP